jgi:hypothetical protein
MSKFNFNFFLVLQISITFIGYVNTKINYKEKYSKILEKGYKSDLQLIFDSQQDPQNEEDAFRKYFHKYTHTDLRLSNGIEMKCSIPSKISKEFIRDEKFETIEKIPEQYVGILLREPSKLCFNSHFDEWFYKLCPTRSATQVLTYQKKDETTGLEYTEEWKLGERLDNSTFHNISIPMEVYQRETNDTTSLNIGTNPFVIVQGRVSIFI